MRFILTSAFFLTLAAATDTIAQDQGLFHVMPPESDIAITRDVVFAQHGDTILKFDLYRSAARTDPAPLLVIFNGFATAGLKMRAQQVGWSKLAAAQGFAVVGYDSHANGEARDFDDVVTYLRTHAGALGIDASTIAFLAWSGHVSRGLAVAMDPARESIKAAVFLYGVGDADSLRMDIPTLFVRAGLDNPRMNHPLDALIARALAANAPITVINDGGGNHGFDVMNDNDVTRSIIDQALSFLKTSVRGSIRESLVANTDVARAAAALYAGNWSAAVPAYEALVHARSGSSDLELRLGQSLLGAREYARALEHLERAWQLDGGGHAIDIGYPAALAAAGTGSFDKAEPWLRILQSRGFTAERLRADSGFESLAADPRFENVFKHPR